MDKLRQNSNLAQLDQQPQIDSASTRELIDNLFGILRRQYPIIILISACAIALSLVYLFTTPKQYTAHALLLIDQTKMRVFQQQEQVLGDQPLDSAQVETQIELLKSEGVGLAVVKELKLTEDSEAAGPRTGLIGAIFELITRPFFSGAISSRSTSSENVLTRKALGWYQARREIRRVGRTYVLDISFRSLSPGHAAQIANGIAEAYIVDQLDAKYQASRRASKWLQDRISELRLEAMSADRAVLDFKEKKNIVDMGGRGGDASGGGRLQLSDQRVLDLNAQLAKARATTAEAKARLDRVQVVMSQEIPDAAVADSLHNEIINSIRTQYLDFSRRYAIYAARYGKNHLAVLNLQTQMTQLRQSMTDELGRIAESYKSDYEIAMAREASLEQSLAHQISGAQLNNRERLGLDELESRARAYHSIHDNFLQRYMEISQQQSLPITEARVITSATAPSGSSSPNTTRILAIAGALGLMLSFAAAALRESLDRVFRTSRQVEQVLGTNCLAVLPLVKNVIAPPSVSGGAPKLAPKSAGSTKSTDPNGPRLLRHVVLEPFSAFAEGLRAVKVAADIMGSIKNNKVIGITSSLPHEGKSTVACNFAELIAHGGGKVILIDGDLRNPTLSRKIVSNANVGLLEVISGKVELRNAIHTDDLTGLSFLPAVIESRLVHSSEIVASEAFKQLIDDLRKTYDYIVIDFPPLAPVVDVRATTSIVDSYVFVVEWGQTRLNMVQRQLESAPEIFDRLLGVVLNKANIKVLNRYEDYYGRYYYKSNYYARYGYTR